MLVNISFDSLGWNALHCGIDAKVRRKNVEFLSESGGFKDEIPRFGG